MHTRNSAILARAQLDMQIDLTPSLTQFTIHELGLFLRSSRTILSLKHILGSTGVGKCLVSLLHHSVVLCTDLLYFLAHS